MSGSSVSRLQSGVLPMRMGSLSIRTRLPRSGPAIQARNSVSAVRGGAEGALDGMSGLGERVGG